jgi:hypothetical protein
LQSINQTLTMLQTPKTPFEMAVQKVLAEQIKAPSVIANGRSVPYFKFQLATHHFNLKLMAKGMTFKGIKFTDLKKYYGLKGRSAKECLPQFEEIKDKYLNDIIASN